MVSFTLLYLTSLLAKLLALFAFALLVLWLIFSLLALVDLGDQTLVVRSLNSLRLRGPNFCFLLALLGLIACLLCYCFGLLAWLALRTLLVFLSLLCFVGQNALGSPAHGARFARTDRSGPGFAFAQVAQLARLARLSPPT